MVKMLWKVVATSWLNKFTLTLSFICIAASCNSNVTISMNSNIPPAFTFKRGYGHINYLDFFIVKEIALENQNLPYMSQNTDKNTILWQVWPKGTPEGRIDKLPIIIYGEVPVGFIQKVPEYGTPPALVEGKVYEAGGPPVIMSKGFLRFIIRDGKAVQVPIPEIE